MDSGEIVYEYYCVLCSARKMTPKLCLAVTKRGKKPDRSDVGKLLPNKCNDCECTTITLILCLLPEELKLQAIVSKAGIFREK